MAVIGARVLASFYPPETTSISISKRSLGTSFFKNRSSFKKSLAVQCMENGRLKSKEYCEQMKDLIRSDGGAGGALSPPRWFTPLECRSLSNKSPLLLYLPGIDGTGLGLTLNHQKLGEIFDVWCLHIPVMDRTPFTELVELLEKTIRSENIRSQNRPIYLVGESIGACLALSVAARNPDVDIVLILANPGTSFRKSPLQPILHLLQVMPEQLNINLPSVLSSVTGIPFKKLMAILEKGLYPHQTVGEISDSLDALSSYVSVMADVLPWETLIWKLQILSSASSYANSRLHAVKAQTLILSSERDLLLPSREESQRLYHMLPNSQIRRFSKGGHALFLEDDVDLVSILKGATFYRRGKIIDYVSDYIPATLSELRKVCDEETRLIVQATCPVMLSTLENGKIVRGLAGVPSKGPVVYVGYHMLLGCEVGLLVTQFLIEKNIVLRGLAHRMLFTNSRLSKQLDVSKIDNARIMGALPVSAANFYHLLASNSHVLLYPGGSLEALHRKGEEYTLCWPEQSEFVRMAAAFGAKIVPFGTVGEDDIGQIILDYTDLMKISNFRDEIQKTTSGVLGIRGDVTTEVANHEMYLPIVLPKIPGRFYYFFGKPIETEGRKHELRRSTEKANEIYAEVKSEVEKCISFLKDKRERDPYRSIISRLIFQAKHSLDTEVPTFEL